MKLRNRWAMPLLRQLGERFRPLLAPAGVYAYVLSAFLVASGAARADDLDVYTKASAVSSGTPVVAMVTDTSVDMGCSLLAASCQKEADGTLKATSVAPTLLNERSYGMKDALRAVMTSGGGNLHVSLTDYDTDGTNDNGRILQQQRRMDSVVSTVSLVNTFSSPFTTRISRGRNDGAQSPSGGLSLSTTGIYVPVKQNESPYGGIVYGSWSSSGGAGLAGLPADGIVDLIADPSYWENAPGNGNKVYYYEHESAVDPTQTFTLDAGTGDSNTVLFVVNISVIPNTVMAYNDDRSYYLTCPTGYSEVLSGINTGKCKKGSDIKPKIAVVNKNSTVTVAGLVDGQRYKIVVATRDPGVADNFTLRAADATKGSFWDAAVSVVENQTAGFYFENIKIPPNATINSAKIVFKRLDGTATSPSLQVGVDESVTPQDFVSQTIGSRSIEWGSSVRTVDPAAALPELTVTNRIRNQVERDGWCQGNAVAIFVRNYYPADLANWLKVASYETDPANAPQLVVDFDPDSGNPDECATVRNETMKIQAMSEDVNQFADLTTDLGKQYMPAAAVDAAIAEKRTKLWISSGTKVGLRFTLAPIPTGATILSAKLKLTAKGTSPAQAIKIYGIQSTGGNAQAFYDEVGHLNEVSKSAPVSWTPTSWIDGATYESGDLSALVQSQVSHPGWTADNTLGFILEGTAADVMYACAWESDINGGFSSTNMADYGGCAAQLELSIDDHGTPQPRTYRRLLVEELMSLKKDGRQPMGGAFLKTAQYLAGKFSPIIADAIDDGIVDSGAAPQPLVATGDCSSNTIIYIADVNEGASYPAGFANQYSSFATSVGGTIAACNVSGSGTNQSSLGCNRELAALLFDGFTPHGYASEVSVKTYTFNFNATAGGAGGGGGSEVVDLTTSDSGGGNLRSIAEVGGGAFKQSSSSAQLVKQLLTVLASVADSGTSVAAPGISVNAMNRFEHLDQLYYSLFKPSTRIDWPGNLKRYQLLNSDVADVNGDLAVDITKNAFFKTTAQSFWSDAVDGATVTAGGAAAESEAAERRIFTHIGDNASVTSATPLEQLVPENNNIDEYSLGIDRLSTFRVAGGQLETDDQVYTRRLQVVDFLRATPKYDTVTLWGASIHNSPRIVAYNSSLTDPVITVFYGDNRGFLHAIDAGPLTSNDDATNLANDGGKELMSFIPQELLRNAALFEENEQEVTVDGYVYGMDGDITLDREDTDFDGVIDRVIVYAGMRRGGSNYYAVDMSSARSDIDVDLRVPKLQWVIEGGVGDYAEMGQTWSALSPNNIYIGGAKKKVLVFGGGYDPAHHDDGVFTSYAGKPFTGVAQKGRALYIADAATGDLIWKSTNMSVTDHPALADMKYSVVATPRLIDRNGDGAYDAIYVVDLAGQVFRFELNKNATGGSNLVSKVVLVAKLGATATGADPVADNRRFYDSPSIAYQGTDVLIGVSSGYREEPGNKGATGTKEAFFFVKDAGAFGVQGTAVPSPVLMSAMSDITSLPSVPIADQMKPGWYIYFDRTIGEKGIGSPVIFNQSILFTSYVVEPVASPCVPDIGKTRLYLMNFQGLGLMDPNTDSVLDRFMDLGLPGMADTPQVIFREGGGIDIGVGVKISDGQSLCAAGIDCPFSSEMFGNLRRSRWYVVDEE